MYFPILLNFTPPTEAILQYRGCLLLSCVKLVNLCYKELMRY
jgi:hypothetical protein